MIDPDFWTDEALGECTPAERLLFMGLISQADDEGRLRGKPSLIRSQIFPYDDTLTPFDIAAMLSALSQRRLIVLYQRGEQEYIWVRNFSKHQTINKPSPSRLPQPPEDNAERLREDSGRTPVGLPPKLREEKRREEEGKGSEDNARARVRESDPVWDAVVELCGAPETADERGDFGRTVKELAAAGATPAQIPGFGPWWYANHRDAVLTHRCLRKHWGRYLHAPPRPPQLTDLSPDMQAHLTADLTPIREEYEAKRASRNHLPAQNGRPFGIVGDPHSSNGGEGQARRNVLPPPRGPG